jgi:D-alanyl-D-alanine carboxypeptidase
MHKVCLRHLLFILISITFSEVKADTFTQVTAGVSNEESDRFGRVLATGDFNGDGFDDLVASAPFKDTSGATNGGKLFIFYGSQYGLSITSETITQNSIDTVANEDGDLLGWALAVGNFNGDEYEDLAVGVPYKNTAGRGNAGMVAILFGSAQGLLPSSTEAFTQNSLVSATNETGDKMGWSLAAGNFNGDNYDDLAIGIPYEDTEEAVVDAGLVGIFFGSEQGLLPSSTEAFTQNSLIGSTNEEGDLFGFALAAGNFNGDAYEDLAVGVPGQDTDGVVDTGLVGIFFGSAQGLLPSDSQAFTQNSINRARIGEGDQMGNELAVGDFNNDNYDDLAIGVAYEDDNGENAGSTYIMYGSGDGLLSAGSEAIGQTKAHDTNEANDLAGSSLATGDFDGDGFDDLIIGVPQEDITHSGENSGTIQAFFGFSGGLLDGLDPHRSYWAGQVSFGGSENAQDQFGFALAVGDFDNNGKDGLAVGAPNKRVYGTDRAGAVYVQEIDPALPEIDARAAIVMDRNTGEILGSKMPDLRRAMASTTKIMTALLAVEALEAWTLELDDLYTISENAAAVGGSGLGPEPGLSEGDQISLRDLLYGTMLESGNDAAIAVAEAVSGSEASFVLDMNLGALRLGLTRTAFQSPHGRDPAKFSSCPVISFEESINLDPDCSHFSTARDLARLANFALNKPLFRELVSTPQWTTTTWANGPGPLNITITNGNGLIVSSHHRFYAGAYGVKTGTTDSAGGCLVFAAERSGVDLVGVVLGSNGLRYTDSTKILDFAFDRAIELPLRLSVNVSRLVPETINELNISFPAKIGKRYRIEKSTDLRDWEALETGIQGSGNIERSFPANAAKYFIRVSEELH